MKIDKLYFVGLMDLGDHFVHAGIINYFADRCNQLHVPVKHHNYETVCMLFQEHPNVVVVALHPHEEDEYIAQHKMSRICNGWNMMFANIGGHSAALLWDEQVYTYYEVPFSFRYNNFRLPRNITGSQELYDRLYKGRPYVLIHRRTGHMPNGIPIDIENFRISAGLPQEVDIIEIEPSITSNLLHYVKLIENASEIHCVNSSFFCLVDSIFNRTYAQLFFHDVRASSLIRVNSDYNRHRWRIINYGTRV
jgi:hypothetical protein